MLKKLKVWFFVQRKTFIRVKPFEVCLNRKYSFKPFGKGCFKRFFRLLRRVQGVVLLQIIFLHEQRTELGQMWLTHRVISDRVHRLLVTLSYFRPDRFVQLLSLIPILILLLYLLVSGCLTSLC